MAVPLKYSQKKSSGQTVNSLSKWQRIILLCVLGFEATGCLLGGGFLVAAPNGKFMKMPVIILHGVFPDFLIPGLILVGMGVLNSAAFITVLRVLRYDWIMTGLALGGLMVWFAVEIAILQKLHWLHFIWGLPVIAGALVAIRGWTPFNK